MPLNINVVHTGLFLRNFFLTRNVSYRSFTKAFQIYNTYELDRLGISSVGQCIMHPVVLAMGYYWVAHFHLVHSVNQHNNVPDQEAN